MGNQQERSLAWLAGIIDGEGSISFQVYTLPDRRIRITPYICVTNSDEGILTEARRIFDALLEDSKHAKARWCNHTNSVKSFASTKPCNTLRVDGVATKLVIDAVLPYLRSEKRKGAQAILDYLESRKNGLLMRDTKGRVQRVGYRLSEIKLVVSARTSKRAKSSEAICSAPNVIVG
jgi:hypothetical protein